MKLNTVTKVLPIYTHEGGKAVHITPEQQLRRSVKACMLWEGEFYESGETIAQRIIDLVVKVPAAKVKEIAIEARTKDNLRHVPLLIASAMSRYAPHRDHVADTLEAIIQRPDELAEFLAIHAKINGIPLNAVKKTIPAQVKKGLARAFTKFNEFALARYNRDADVRLRDVAFLTHVKPRDKVNGINIAKLVNKDRYPKATKSSGFKVAKEYGLKKFERLPIPDTWETELSAGKDKGETFARLITEGKMGGLAMLRNLRNMEQAGVDRGIIKHGLDNLKSERILPFRFIAAARHVPNLEDLIEPAMLKCLEGKLKIPGKTILLVDVSRSMDCKLSSKSEISRLDAACGLAILLREVCEEVQVTTFSSTMVVVPNRRGFALRDAITTSQPHGVTYLARAIDKFAEVDFDRIIVITDEQTMGEALSVKQAIEKCSGKGCLINVASAQNGVGYGKWLHIDGWSDSVVDYIIEAEAMESGMDVAA